MKILEKVKKFKRNSLTGHWTIVQPVSVGWWAKFGKSSIIQPLSVLRKHLVQFLLCLHAVNETYSCYSFSLVYMPVCVCILPDLSGLLLVHLCVDFKIIWHSCCPWEVEVPFETGWRSRSHLRSDDKMVINWACRGHNLYIYAWISK